MFRLISGVRGQGVANHCFRTESTLRFWVNFSITAFYDANLVGYREWRYKCVPSTKITIQSWLGPPRRLREHICHVIFGKNSLECANSCVTCDSRDREYGTFLTRFFHDRFSRYKSYEFRRLRYQSAPSSKNTRQKLPSSNFGFTSLLSSLRSAFSDFLHFSWISQQVTRR